MTSSTLLFLRSLSEWQTSQLGMGMCSRYARFFTNVQAKPNKTSRTWLYDIREARKKDTESSPPSTKYHGFDISPDLFPKPGSPRKVADIDFTAHDFYKPFPEEHIGKYDLVHARHLILAVEGADLIPATKHITSLLSTSLSPSSKNNCLLNNLTQNPVVTSNGKNTTSKINSTTATPAN